MPSDYKKTRYSEEHNLLPVFLLPFTLSLFQSLLLLSTLSPLCSKLVAGPLTAIMRYEGMN